MTEWHMIAEADKRFGRVDVLVNAGALTDRGTILDTTPEGRGKDWYPSLSY